MPRIFRLIPRELISAVVSWGIVYLFFDMARRHPDKAYGLWCAYFVLIGTIYVSAKTFGTWVKASDSGITLVQFFRFKKFHLGYDEVNEYIPSVRGEWKLAARGDIYRLPAIDFHEFHRLAVEKMPKALRAKRWRTGQLPPPEEFDHLWLFDGRGFMSTLLGAVLVGGGIFLFSPAMAVGYFLASVLPHLLSVNRLFGTLSIRTEGLSQWWPLKKRSLAWNEIEAVFCEKERGKRVFVVVGPSFSVAIPAHLAVELETMRKFFYSLPEGTRCVNFDENFKKGYRTRRRRRAPTGQTPELAPMPGFWVNAGPDM